nr:hypothetical protein [Tanacetum cinerariifolium]
MRDKHFDTISATKSNEFIKSSVENLVPNPSESEGEHECDVPACDDFTTLSNILFDADDDISSSDDQFFGYSSSSKIDSLFEFTGELALLKLIPPGINETDCDHEEETRLIKRLLYDNSSPRPPKEFISKTSNTAIESFSPSPIPVKDSDSLMKEINLSFTLDGPMPPDIEEDDYDSERDILILEEFLSNDSFHFLKMNHFILIFLYPLVLLQNHQMEKSPNFLSHLGHQASQPSTECPMMIYGRNTPILDVLILHFYPP